MTIAAGRSPEVGPAATLWVEVEGGRLRVEQLGQGPPLVLLHGWTLDCRMFEPQLSKLGSGFRAIAYDRRGFGRSQAAPDLNLELDDIDKVANALSLGTFHLLGMSQGGRVALRYAVTSPERVRSLILQGAAVDGLPIDEPECERIPLAEYARLARAGKMGLVRRRWLEHPLMALGSEHGQAKRLVEEIIADYGGADLMAFSPERQRFAGDLIGGLGKLHAPTLILTGAHEVASRRAQARKLLEIIPNSREILCRRSGHLSNLTEPDFYNEQVGRFCTEVERDSIAPEAATEGRSRRRHS